MRLESAAIPIGRLRATKSVCSLSPSLRTTMSILCWSVVLTSSELLSCCSNAGKWRVRSRRCGREQAKNENCSSRMTVTQTERLLLRWLDVRDSGFIFELVNEPSWLRYIGDKGVKTLQDAQRDIEDGPIEMYQRLGL